MGAHALIQTKIRPPVAATGMIERPRLVAELTATGTSELVVVTGMAGAGKTTLVRQWIDGMIPRRTVAWLTVDERDNDPSRFWEYVCAAISVGSQPPSGWVGADSVGHADIEGLAERAGQVGSLLLVLDDVHVLSGRQVLAQLDVFLSALPAGVQPVLVSRLRPPFRLARRSAAGQVLEIRGADLLFTPQETRQLLGATDAVRRQRADAVHASTGGWPIAVSLSAHLPTRREGDATRSHRRRQQLTDYLTEEVLRGQTFEVQQFLLDTSILDEITVAASNHIREVHDSARYVAELEAQEAFLTRLGCVDQSLESAWHLHMIVRDYLRRQLAERQPERRQCLLRRAARFYQHQQVDVAVDYALLGEDWGYAADLLTQVGEQTQNPPSVGRRLRWFRALPDSLLAERSDLRAFAVNLAAFACQPDLARRWARAGKGDSRSDDVADLVVDEWQRAASGDLIELGRIATAGLENCSPDSPFWFSLVLGRLVAENARGDWSAANVSARLLRAPATSCPPELLGVQEYLWAQVTITHAREGDLKDATRALHELSAWVADAKGVGISAAGRYREWAAALVAAAGATTIGRIPGPHRSRWPKWEPDASSSSSNLSSTRPGSAAWSVTCRRHENASASSGCSWPG